VRLYVDWIPAKTVRNRASFKDSPIQRSYRCLQQGSSYERERDKVRGTCQMHQGAKNPVSLFERLLINSLSKNETFYRESFSNWWVAYSLRRVWAISQRWGCTNVGRHSRDTDAMLVAYIGSIDWRDRPDDLVLRRHKNTSYSTVYEVM